MRTNDIPESDVNVPGFHLQVNIILNSETVYEVVNAGRGHADLTDAHVRSVIRELSRLIRTEAARLMQSVPPKRALRRAKLDWVKRYKTTLNDCCAIGEVINKVEFAHRCGYRRDGVDPEGHVDRNLALMGADWTWVKGVMKRARERLQSQNTAVKGRGT